MTPKEEARRAMAITLCVDLIAAALSMSGALYLGWVLTSTEPLEIGQPMISAVVTFSLSALVSFYLLNIHKQVWRHMGWSDVVRVIQAVILTGLIFLPVIFFWNQLVGIPVYCLGLALPLWLAIILIARMIALTRSTNRPLQIFGASVRADAPLAVLVCDASTAADVLRDTQRLEKGAPVRILGLIELDGVEHGRAIRGVPVMGSLEDLGKVMDLLNLRYQRMPIIGVAGEARRREVMSDILECVSARNAELMSLDTANGGARVQPLQPADLLARPERKLDPEPVETLLRDARIFVTGAGGTIGSELTRQCARQAPAELALFDASEYNLYDIDLRLRRTYPDLVVSSRLGDVRDRMRIYGALHTVKPDIVLHAAALKHVPLMERNVCEAILTNVGGAVQTAEAAIEAGAKRFVFISTDKAVDPDNVMGATKRLAELAVARAARDSGMAVSMVRFGNVLGSSGSVVPLFERQIAEGGPVTLTHPDVTRYFMTVEEASSLVLQAAARNGAPGQSSLYVLDMGEPVKIQTLAESMIRLKGLVPGQDIEIETTGLRPGEKLHEMVTYTHEHVDQTEIDGLLKVHAEIPDMAEFDALLRELLDTASRRDREAALILLGKLVTEYRPEYRRAG